MELENITMEFENFEKYHGKMRGNLENENFSYCQYTFQWLKSCTVGKVHSLDLNNVLEI